MKQPLLLLLLLGLVGCKYSSREQAEIACNEWKEKAEVIRYKVVGENGIIYDHFNRNRACYNAFWDNQYEGYYGEFDDDDRSKEGKLLKDSDTPKVKGMNKKYFRY